MKFLYSLKVILYKTYVRVYTSDGMLTKHYFTGDQRIASRLTDVGTLFYTRPGNSRDKENEKAPDTEADFRRYFEQAGYRIRDVEKEFAKGPVPGQGVYYLHGDHLGIATYVTNEYAEPTQFFLNLLFGETMVEQQEPTAYVNPYRFNAKELDSETGLYYYGARYYNPRLSIWYGVDPLAVYHPVMEDQFYGDGQHNGGVYHWGNLNPYIYCYENPIIYVDPNGKQSMAGALRGVPDSQKDDVLTGWREGLRKGGCQIDFVPGFGDAKGVIEGIVGTDMQGNKLSWFDRGLSILFLSELRNTKTGIKVLSDVEKVRKITNPLWGATIKYAGEATTAMEHIAKGHFFNSRAGQATSRFLQKYSNASSVKELVQEAVAKGKHGGGKGNYSIIHTFDEVIGTTSEGRKTSTLQVYLDKAGNVINTYPVPNSKKK